MGTGGDGTCSSLDLVDTRARCLTLFVSASSDGQSWSSAAATMNDERDREHASSGASCSGRELTVVTMRASEWLGLCTRREQRVYGLHMPEVCRREDRHNALVIPLVDVRPGCDQLQQHVGVACLAGKD